MNSLSRHIQEKCAQFPAPLLEKTAFFALLALPWLMIISRGGSDAAGVLISLLFLLHSAKNGQWRWTKDPVFLSAIVAWGWMLCIASPLAADVGGSFGVAVPWLRWPLLFAACTSWLLCRPERLRACAINSGVMLALVMIDTVWQYIFGVSLSGHVPNQNYRLTGPMDNVKVGIFIAKICFPVSAILMYQAIVNKKRSHVIATGVFLLACVGTVLLSGERTAFFTCLLALAITSLVMTVAEPAYRAKTLTSVAIVLGLSLVMLITQPVLQDRLSWLFHNISGFSTSSYGELDWVGLQLGMQHPVTGVGLKGFRLLCLPYEKSGLIAQCNLHPHNPYIEWFAELGAPGLLLFLTIVGTLMIKAWRAIRTHKAEGRLLASVSLSVIAMNFFPLMATQSFFSNWPALLLWHSIAIAIASLNMLDFNSTHKTMY